jgi:hypothetical protein
MNPCRHSQRLFLAGLATDRMATSKRACMVKSIEELHARRGELRSKIGELITSSERVDQVINHWDKTVEMSSEPRDPQTSIEVLLREHYEICQQILVLQDDD